MVLTDLDSTNGTRVNGQTCNLKILRIGDTISIGRSVLLLCNRENAASQDGFRQPDEQDELELNRTRQKTYSIPVDSDPLLQLPRGLSTGQAAELRELLDHVHAGLRGIVENGTLDEKAGNVVVDQQLWKQLLNIQSEIAVWIRSIEDPQTSQS